MLRFARTRGHLILIGILLLFGDSRAALAKDPPPPKNLVDNPTFDKSGDAIPGWKVQSIARKTTFEVVGGVLTATRGPGPMISADSILQKVYLPEDTRALRVGITAAAERMMRAEFVVTFTDRNGSPLGRETLFHLNGTMEMGLLDRDVILPEGTIDAEVALRVYGEGTIRLDAVDVRALDPLRVRAAARIVVVRGVVQVARKEETPVENVEVSFPVPPPTESQAPAMLHWRLEPGGKVSGARMEREEGRHLLHLNLGTIPGKQTVEVHWTVRLVIAEPENFDAIPDEIRAVPIRHLSRRLEPWVHLAPDFKLREAFARVIGEVGEMVGFFRRVSDYVRKIAQIGAGSPIDPMAVMTTMRGSPSGRANLAAALFRAGEIPARPVVLVPVGLGDPFQYGIEVFQKEHGWLLFSLEGEAARPASRLGHVLLSTGPAQAWTSLEGPWATDGVVASYGKLAGIDGGDPVDATEVGRIVLDPGMGADLIKSIAKAWERATRKLNPTEAVSPGRRLSLAGKARRLKNRIPEILGE